MNDRNFKIPLLCVAIAVVLICSAGTAFAGIPVKVVVNKSVLLNLKKIRYVTIANPDIVTVPDPFGRDTLQINGKKIGSTSMIVWQDNVDRPSFFDIDVVGDEDAVESRIREYAPKDAITAQYVNDTLVLSGTVANELTAKKAEEIARAYSAKVVSQIGVNNPLQVLLEVKVAQVDKTSLKNLGISAIVKGSKGEGFTNLVGAPATMQTITNRSSSTSSFINQGAPGINGNGPFGIGGFDQLGNYQIGVSYFPAGIGAVLQALTTKGLAKMLAEPNLLVRSGQEGNFLAGSRIPYSVLVSTGGASTSSIVFETVGVKLKFKPLVLENGLISLVIDPAEVSSIAGTLSVNGYPIIDTRDVRTSVELRDGESLVLAGLLQEEQIKNMSKIPILGDIPILGALFRSTQEDIREKELVFFITPKIVQPNPPGFTPELPTDREPDPDELHELDWMPLGEK